MTEEHVEVRAVVWREVFPWMLLPRAFAVAISPRVLLLALLALLGSAAGWNCFSWLLVEEKSNGEHVLKEGIEETSLGQVKYLCEWPGERHDTSESPRHWLGTGGPGGMEDPVFDVGWRLLYPWRELVSAPDAVEQGGGRTWKELTFYLGGGLWSLLVWSLFAGAITRIAALRLGPEERVGARRALDYARRRLGQYFAAPLLPLLGVILLAILPAIGGLLMRVSFFAAVGGVLWFIMLIFGLLMTLLLLGLMVGWPLMWPAISAEGRNGDSFDALSRSYGYAFGRPLNYLLYAVVAAIIGMLGWVVVTFVANGVIEMSYWSTSLGSGSARVSELRDAAEDPQDNDENLVQTGGDAIGWWVGVVWAFANAFSYAYFWCAATAIYLLLRRDVDQAEIEAVEPEGDEVPISLPPLTKDAEGVAGAAGAPPRPETDDRD